MQDLKFVFFFFQNTQCHVFQRGVLLPNLFVLALALRNRAISFCCVVVQSLKSTSPIMTPAKVDQLVSGFAAESTPTDTHCYNLWCSAPPDNDCAMRVSFEVSCESFHIQRVFLAVYVWMRTGCHSANSETCRPNPTTDPDARGLTFHCYP